MTSSELAILVYAKREGKGKWIVKCPAHADRNASCAFRDGKTGILVNCRSHQCPVKDICDAWGIKMGDLFFGKMSPKVVQLLDESQKLRRMEHRHGWMLVGKAVEYVHKSYYDAAITGLEKDIREMRDLLYPDEALNRRREQEFKRNLRLYGWSGMWKQVLPRFNDVRESSR